MTPFKNPFVKPAKEYQRDIDVLRHYVHDQTLYLHLSTGKPIEECQRFISEALKPGGVHAFKDPTVHYLQRGDNGDRVKFTTTLRHYIQDSVAKKELIAPTLTTYLSPLVKQSLLSIYIADNIKARSKAKKEMFAAKAAKNKTLYAIKKIEQTGKKLGNNAISGAHVSPSTPLYNKTAHSTLTSVCRSTSGYGNANNEKFLTGNRHYFTHHLVLDNIISIIRNTDYEQLQIVVEKYKLHLPSVAETLACIKYSTDLYWREVSYFEKIVDLVGKLSPLQRAAFVYTGDLYHLKKFNDAFVRNFIKSLACKVSDSHPDPDAVLKTAPEDHVHLAHLLCKRETAGIGKNYASIKGTPAYDTLASTVANIAAVLTQYADIIGCLWVTSNLPASVAHFPSSIRRSALTSDTDSTIFTVQDWSIWYHGKITFDVNKVQVADTVVFLASSTITNVLAVMSANFGILEKDLFAIAMKNEYKFDVFIPTQIGKHYFADIGAQEGDVFPEDEHETEVKGVGLKSSNSARTLINQANVMMKDILKRVRETGQLSMITYLKQIADIERSVITSIQKGESLFLRSGTLKDAAGYTSEPEDSPYLHHGLWNDCFGPTYGMMEPPPYTTLKVSVDLGTSLKLQRWLCNQSDRAFANRVNDWCKKTGRSKITTLNLPMSCVQNHGIPKEVLNVINYDKIISDVCRIFYLILECLGYYSNGDKVRRRISTYY